MQHISVIGAGGFVGSSLIESLVFDGDVTVGAVVRAYRNFAGLCRHGSAVTIHVADAEDARELARAIQGSSIVINVTTGPPASIVRSTRTIYDACVSAR